MKRGETGPDRSTKKKWLVTTPKKRRRVRNKPTHQKNKRQERAKGLTDGKRNTAGLEMPKKKK